MARTALARRCSLRLRMWRSTLACFACARCHDRCGRFFFCQRGKGAALARRLFLLSERARYGVSAAASNAKPAPCVPHGAGAQALAVSRKEAQHSTLLRARLAALVLVGVFSTKERCPDEMLLSFGAKLWCDVPAVASNLKPAPRGSRGEDAAGLAVAGEEAQHSSLIRARAVPRWL